MLWEQTKQARERVPCLWSRLHLALNQTQRKEENNGGVTVLAVAVYALKAEGRTAGNAFVALGICRHKPSFRTHQMNCLLFFKTGLLLHYSILTSLEVARAT